MVSGVGCQRTEDREQKTEVRLQRADNRGQMTGAAQVGTEADPTCTCTDYLSVGRASVLAKNNYSIQYRFTRTSTSTKRIRLDRTHSPSALNLIPYTIYLLPYTMYLTPETCFLLP